MDVNRAGPSRAIPVLLLLSTSLVAACGGESRPDSPPGEPEVAEKGRLVVIGGGLQSENVPVYQAVLEGREGDGPLCVIPTASGTPARSMEGYVSAFDSVGGPGTSRGIMLTVDNPDDARRDELARELAGCAGFFFTGGSQDRISLVLRPDGGSTPAFEAIRARHMEGAVVAGSSAGAAIMTDPMIAGGGSLEALEAGVTLEESSEGVWVTTGLGFMETGIIDQHFLARGRWGRLLVTVLHGEGDGLGLGIDENTALVVEGDSVRVIGESSAVFMDARQAREEAGEGGGAGVRLFLLGRGDVLHLPEGVVRWHTDKETIGANHDAAFPQNGDLFAPWTLLEVLHALATGAVPEVDLPVDGFRIRIARGPGFQAVALDGRQAGASGIRGTPPGLGMGPITVAVETGTPPSQTP